MIVKDIDAAITKLAVLQAKAAGCDAESCIYRAAENKTAMDEAQMEADKLWARADRLKNTRLKKLKLTLAAFDTKPMFGDEQVVLQGVEN